MATKVYFKLLILLFLAIIYISFSQEIQNVYLKPIQIVQCIKIGTSSYCSIANINSSDNSYENIGITGNMPSNYGLINVTFERFRRYDINLLNLTAGIEGIRCRRSEGISGSINCDATTTQLGNNMNDRCYFGVRTFQDNILLNEFPNSSSTCNLWMPGTETRVELPIINNITSLRDIAERNLSVIWYGYDANDTWVVFKIDYMYVNITYFDLAYSNWNFYNSSDNSILQEPVRIIRGQNIIAAALYNISDVNLTYVIHNGDNTLNRYDNANFSALFRIANISRFRYWINFTINTSDLNQFRRVGSIFITLTAANRLGGFNTTFTKNFTLYGFSKTNEINLNDHYIYPSEIVEINCSVIDANLSIPIAKYPINFYINENFVGNRLTEEKGYALLNYKINEVGDYEIKCSIDNQENLYYYTSENREISTNLKVLELSANISLIPNLNFGELQIISINITNASKISYVYANISYKNISDYELKNVYEIKNFTFNTCYEPYLCNYNLTFIPPRSGFYDLTIYIDAGSPNGILTIKSNFTVNFGRTNITIIFPNFDKILINQTFLIKLNISSIDGDVWNVNISLNSSNYDILSLLENIYKPKLFSIAKDNPLIIEYLVESKNLGNAEILINAVPLNGSSSNLSKTFEIISFNTSISKSILNFGEKIEYFVNITGNTSEILHVYARIHFFNISNCKLNFTNLILNFSLNFSSTIFYSYNLIFAPPRSGNYFTEIYVITKNGTIKNTTNEYFVNFGKTEIFAINPFYFVLTNQTFNLTIGVKAIKGDVWNVSTNVSILNQEAINLTDNENNFHLNSIEAIANGTFCIDEWKVYSKYEQGKEITTIIFYAIPENGSSSTYSESFEIILPLKPYIIPNITFIDEFTIFYIPIFGNASNFTIKALIDKPFNSESESILFNLAERKNYTECGIRVETGNIASLRKGTNIAASIKNENAYRIIDENIETSWSQENIIPAQINLTFRQIFTIKNIKIVWSTGRNTSANISFIDPSDNINLLFQNIEVSQTTTNITLDLEIPIKAKGIIINFSDLVNLYEIEIYPIEPRLDYCYIFYYNFTNFTRSDYYNVKFEAISSFNDIISYSNTSFFVNYGIPRIEVSEETIPIMLSGQVQNYSITVIAERGDLKNLYITFNSSNLEYINITENEVFSKFIPELLWNEKVKVNWSIYAKIKEEQNITILTYINATAEKAFNSSLKEYKITIYPLDIEPPIIHDFWFEIKNKASNIFNLNDSLKIVVNASDNIYISKVIAEIIYPDGNTTSVNLQRGDLWSFIFPKNDIQINQTGNFKVKIYVYDLNETFNINVSDFKSFNVVDTYFIYYDRPNILIYNFGENITFFVKDLNNFIVEDIYWEENNYNISRISTNLTIILSNNTFNIGNISLNISAYKYGNRGNIRINFTLSDQLNIKILSPPNNYNSFERRIPLDFFGLEFLPSIIVQNVRKDRNITNAYIEVYCLDYNSNYTKFDNTSFFYNACNKKYELYSFEDCKSKCFSPNSFNQQFNISFYAEDEYGNKGFNYVILFTKSLPQQNQPAIGGSFGGIGAPLQLRQCECTSWQDVGCGKGKCALNQMYQVRSCKPAGCEIEERCVENILCKPSEIEFLIDDKISLSQGETKLLSSIIRNIGEKEVLINIEYNSSCCKVSLNENKFKLNIGEIRSLAFTISSYLNETPGEHILEINIFDSLENKKLISKNVIIVLNLNKLFTEKNKLIIEFFDLTQLLQEFEKYNILEEDVKNLVKRNQELIKLFEDCIKNNDLKGFENSVVEFENNLAKIKNYLESKKLQLFFAKYKNEMIISIIVSLIMSYLTSQIILPYFKISREIRKLQTEEEIIIRQRREIQKQYFLRKISEEIFKKLITDTQNKILEIRGKIKTLNEEKSKLLKERLSPIYIIKKLSQIIKLKSKK